MAGRGPQTFKKRQKEQQRKERQQEKLAKKLQRKQAKADGTPEEDDEIPLLGPEDWPGITDEDALTSKD